MRGVKIFLGALFFLMMAFTSHEGAEASESEDVIAAVLHDAETHLNKTAARRPFRFKGMNESLRWSLEAVQLLNNPETADKIAPPAVWSSSSPLSSVLTTQGLTAPRKQVLKLLDKAGRSFSQNTFAVALKAYVYQSAGQSEEASRYWEEYAARSQAYSSFDKEVLSQRQYHALREYAKSYLVSRGIDVYSRENMTAQMNPLELFWHVVTHPKPEEKTLNLIFIMTLITATILLVVMGVSGMEFYRSLGFSLVAIYAAVWLSYGCWIYDLAYGLPWGLSRVKVAAIILSTAAAISLYEAWTGWRDAHPQLEDGYRRCPRCKEVIVKLSVECVHCKKKIA